MKSVWVIGHHAVDAVLRTNPQRAIIMYVVRNERSQAQKPLIGIAEKIGLSIQFVEKANMTKLCGSVQHQGVALAVKPKIEGNEKQLSQYISRLMDDNQQPLILILDQVQDPHNLGACLRTANAAGVHAVVVPKDNSSPITPTVQKVASGAVETVELFRVTNLSRAIENVKELGIWVVGTSDKATHSIYQQDLTGPLAIVMGAEGDGLRTLTQKKCDLLLKIPMFGKLVSSLNVSVATGVCLYEVVRQRLG